MTAGSVWRRMAYYGASFNGVAAMSSKYETAGALA